MSIVLVSGSSGHWRVCIACSCTPSILPFGRSCPWLIWSLACMYRSLIQSIAPITRSARSFPPSILPFAHSFMPETRLAIRVYKYLACKLHRSCPSLVSSIARSDARSCQWLHSSFVCINISLAHSIHRSCSSFGRVRGLSGHSCVSIAC